ncbi:MAG: alpha/beta hydrolase, partial [Alphaproteobacteria bacterium]
PNHYLVPDLVGAGYAAWVQSPRSVGVDLRLEHEQALLDLASGISRVRSLGYRRIVMLGNSGGASLHAFYIQQAQLAPEHRIERTPAGGRTKLAAAEMPVPDAVVFVAPHPGQGVLLQACIDPSVANEHDALSVDPALNPLDPQNGFRPSEEGGARYAREFVARYAAAQRARVERLDATARTLIRERRDAQARVKAGGTAADRVRAAHTPVMTIWRTSADLRCFDLSLDPSDRKFGTVWGANPYAANYGALGFARFCLPEAWLSTWSGLSSNAAIAKTGSSITQPTLVIEYTGDQTVFPGDIKGIVAAVGSSNMTHERIRGDHHGRPLAAGEEPGRFIAGRMIVEWLRDAL